MASSSSFEWACEALEATTSLDRLEARGTLRIALKTAGLDARNVTAEQIKTVILRVLPAELEARGIEDASLVCDQFAERVPTQQDSDHESANSPERVFARLGGR